MTIFGWWKLTLVLPFSVCSKCLVLYGCIQYNRDIQVDEHDIAPLAKIKKWKQLKSTSDEIVQEDRVQFCLLIGANCLKVLEETKIIRYEDGVPYACRTRLG